MGSRSCYSRITARSSAPAWGTEVILSLVVTYGDSSYGAWRAPVKQWQTTIQFASCFLFFFFLETGTFCTEICTKQNRSSVKWKSSRLFPRCTALFVQAADLGEGAQDTMPAPLGKCIQTMVYVWKGEQINQDQGISQLLFLKKDSIARKQSTHKNNT